MDALSFVLNQPGAFVNLRCLDRKFQFAAHLAVDRQPAGLVILCGSARNLMRFASKSTSFERTAMISPFRAPVWYAITSATRA